MDHQHQRGRSPSAGHHSNINQHHSPSHSPSSFSHHDQSPGLGLGLNQQSQHVDLSLHGGNPPFTSSGDLLHPNQQHQQPHLNHSDPTIFDPNAGYNQAAMPPGADPNLSFTSSHPNYMSPNLSDHDFPLFPSQNGAGDQFNVPLFEQSTLDPTNLSGMASPQAPQHAPTPPHLLQPDAAHHPGSAQQSPSFSPHQFSSPPVSHSRNASLGPEAALLPNQLGEWTQPQFQNHRRTPSEYSDVSSVSPSPNLVSSDSFDHDPSGHSPLHRASDGSMYADMLNMNAFSLSDQQSNPGRSPSHSPAISPRILPQQGPDMSRAAFGLVPPGHAFPSPGFPAMQPQDAFPTLQSHPSGMDMPAPPAINIDFAPTNPARLGHGSQMDQDSLTPPNRGRPVSRPRAVTDPFHPGGGMLGRPKSGSPSPSLGSNLGNRHDSRSLSPHGRGDSASPNRRRSSASSVHSAPNNVIALRLADPEFQGSSESGNAKRVQKHPATFQCTLCPKRFTRAYNLRSHLRTHTDERPFVCTVCGKAFARQHDRKRHESLHSGEKKFVCKGDLKGSGQWGCGRRFARADALGRHFRSEAGRICIKPLLDEEMVERQRQWQEQRMKQDLAQNMNPGMPMDPGPSYPMDPNGGYAFPAALLAQYPVLAQFNLSGPDMGDEMSGRSSFDASDYDDGDDGGYVSGPGTGFGDGGLGQNFGEIGYASDYGNR